ncbi:zinc finger BED domain-containing protein RICESLEEPER 2-like [Silene latifolia]|uniref:zinc finger BED domain-containing protein RICESLEEPER 2-like n=1 Tax=Silene latifolia TaxID=37657 RepID=UPI003D78A812
MSEPSEPISPLTRPIVEEYFVNVDDEMEIVEEIDAQVTEKDTHPHLNSTEDVLAEESPPPHPFKRERKAEVWKDFLDPTLIFSISVDNASANDTCIQVLKNTFSLTKRLVCDGKLFHVRCCAHILNIIVQHGLKEVKIIIYNVHESVDYINQSDLRLKKFTELVQQFNLKESRLVLECKTRWNSTYEMLACAIKFKKVFARLAQEDRNYTYCPSAEDWVKIKKLSEILEVFNDTTNIISGSEYPTSNLFLDEIYRIKVLLDTQFDKYWDQCNLLMAIGAVLDPRLKMKVVEITFPKMFPSDDADVARDNVNKVRETLYELYKEYVTIYSPTGQSDKTEGSSSMSIRSNTPGFSELLRAVRSEDTIESRKSEVDDYLDEGCYVPYEDECFDALEWWKDKSMKFRILFWLAAYILAVPITTVASEATFSAGSRVIDPYRASLSSDAVQMLLCIEDWCRSLYGLKRKNKVIN